LHTGHRIAFVGGAVRSGKSAFALRWARARGERRVFVATAQAFDAEMRRRIDAHVRERGAEFRTLEAPIALPEALAQIADADVVVVDCLTLWLSNLLLAGAAEAEILDQVAALGRVLVGRPFHSVIVSNEVGMGVVPESPLGRAFRDLTGSAHQALVGVAHDVYWAMLGGILRVKPEPITFVPPGEIR
jgi:adenosylcobinamide kinase/adenosylcobinamide-phosphate guanylyltransferase